MDILGGEDACGGAGPRGIACAVCRSNSTRDCAFSILSNCRTGERPCVEVLQLSDWGATVCGGASRHERSHEGATRGGVL